MPTRNKYGALLANAERNAESVQHLHRQLERVAAFLDYMTFSPQRGIELTRHDYREVRAQLKVTKHVLKITKP